jgi:hypothetical protein
MPKPPAFAYSQSSRRASWRPETLVRKSDVWASRSSRANSTADLAELQKRVSSGQPAMTPEKIGKLAI